MVTKFTPELNKVYFINQYTMLQILNGSGSIEVDFKHYFDWKDKIIFLEKGQYIKFLSDSFTVRKIEFPDEAVFREKEIRVLFKHLISLGYINFSECEDCQKYLSSTVFSPDNYEIIDISSQQWFWQNPFQAKREEYHIIFDVKDIIDQEYHNQLTNRDISALIKENGHHAQALVKDKVGLTIKNLLQRKKLLEGKKEIAFTDKSIKEISYELGFEDPAYFNRVFKKQTGKNPKKFREDFDFQNRDSFIENIIELLATYHTQERKLDFYADKMHLSVKTLSKKVKDKMNASLGQLIRYELMQSAEKMLIQGNTIKETALYLGFEEPNHFSAFFKKYKGVSPSEFQK